MARIFFIILLIVTSNSLFAQYVHYSDNRNINNTTTHATTASKATPDTFTRIVRDTVMLRVRDTMKTVVHDTLRLLVHDTIEIVLHDTINICPTVETVYHKWPDRCPGLSGSIPVLINYIAPEMVLKLTEIYKGHLYSISSTKNARNKVRYKLKVCENGVIRYEYADENGTIMSQREPEK